MQLNRLVDDNPKHIPTNDGEYFWSIRFYHGQNNSELEKRAWAGLEKSKRQRLKQLLTKPDLARAFDDLVPYPALWRRLRLGALKRLHSMKCDEVGTTKLARTGRR